MDTVCLTPVPLIGMETVEFDTLVRMTIVPTLLPVAVGAKVIPMPTLFPAPMESGKLSLLLTNALLAMYASDRVMAVLPEFLIVRSRVAEEPRYTFPKSTVVGFT